MPRREGICIKRLSAGIVSWHTTLAINKLQAESPVDLYC